jgi:hypothetical protein
MTAKGPRRVFPRGFPRLRANSLSQAMNEAHFIFALLAFAFAIRFAWLELRGN